MTPLPPLIPVYFQLPLPTPDVSRLQRQLNRLVLNDALVYGRERIEYVELVGGGYHQIRWYKGDRIVGVACVHNHNPAPIKAQLALMLVARGWSGECEIERGAAYWRRRTRRQLPGMG